MNFETEHVYHVYNQGNNRQKIFTAHKDYKYFLSLVKSYILPHSDVIAWCLLPNHFHFMLVPNDQGTQPHTQGNLKMDLLTNGVRRLLSTYAHYFNKEYNQSGSLFRPKTKAKDLSINHLSLNHGRDNDYYINCFYYIHQNPLRHNLVTDLKDWKYSSFKFYSGERVQDMCNKQLAVQLCDYHEKTFSDLVYHRLPDILLHFFDHL